MNLLSKISFSKTITAITSLLIFSSIVFQLYQGTQAYAQANGTGITIGFPVESVKNILNSVNKANTALSDGDMELLSESIGEIDTEVRDQLDKANVPLNSTSDGINDVLVQEIK